WCWERAGCGNGSAKGVADEGTQTLIAGKEEEFVFLDWPTKHAAELFQLRWQLGLWTGVEEIARGPVLAAAKCETRSVKRVGPGPDSDVHHSAWLPAVLRLRVFLEIEFLYRVDGQDRRSIGQRTRHIRHRTGISEIGIDNAVQHPRGL